MGERMYYRSLRNGKNYTPARITVAQKEDGFVKRVKNIRIPMMDIGKHDQHPGIFCREHLHSEKHVRAGKNKKEVKAMLSKGNVIKQQKKTGKETEKQ